MSRIRLTRWLQGPFVTGWLALLCGVLAVAVPTIVRVLVNGVVTGCEFTPYLPFVLLTAILLGWRQAAAVALASAAVFSGLFVVPPNEFVDQSCAISAVGIFLVASAIIIGIVIVIRHAIVGVLSHPDNASGGVIFSLDEGQVWASWYGQGPPVCLGSRKRVAKMMADFLTQEELAKRLDANANKLGT
jgi:hypothetical protein